MPVPRPAAECSLGVEARLVNVDRPAHQLLRRRQPAGMAREAVERLVEAMGAVDEANLVRLRLRNDLGAFPCRHGLDLGPEGRDLVFRKEGGEKQVPVVLELAPLGLGECGHD